MEKKLFSAVIVFLTLTLILSGCTPETKYVNQTILSTQTIISEVTKTVTETVTVTSNPSTNITTDNNSIAVIRSTYETYLTYEKYKQWDKVWDMLHPDSQALFGTEAYFIEYQNEAFSGTSIKSFEIGNIEIISAWNFNLIGKVYNNTAEIQVSIVLSTILGDIQNSQVVHSVLYNDNWCFFMGYSSTTTTTTTTNTTTTPLTTTTTPLATTTTSDVGLSRSNPVPRGFSLITADGIEITITNVITGSEAWDIIYNANMFNDAPETGYQYIIITVTVRNVSGSEPYSVNYWDFSLVGNSNILFQSADRSVVLPDSGELSALDVSLFIGGQSTASIPFYIPINESDMVLISDLGYSFSQDYKRYFAVY